MFSGTRGLGYPQNVMTTDEWYDPSVGPGDLDLISIAYLSPDAGYPPQRINEYNAELKQHTTLNGLAAGATQRYEKSIAPSRRFMGRAYAGNRHQNTMTPRYAKYDISK